MPDQALPLIFPTAPAVTKPEPIRDFDWSERDAVVVWEQPRTAVYTNPHDQVVIRQMTTIWDEEDPYLYFSRENVPALIAALQRVLDEAEG